MTFTEIASVLGNVGEFVGSIAVVVTLIFLIVQIRQGKELLGANKDALDLSNRLQIADSWDRLNSELRETDKLFLTDEALRSVWVAGEERLNDLSELDRMQYQRVFNIQLYTHLAAFSRAR